MYESSNLALSTISGTNDGHTDKKKHKCFVCLKLFCRKSTLLQHKKIHANEKNNKCDVCSKLFRKKFNLLQHKKIHTNEKNNKCDVCSKLFHRKFNLVQHKKKHTNEKNHKCDVCSKLFRLKSHLVQHKKIHTHEKPHKCDVCSKLFRFKSNLVEHKKIHTNEKKHKCDVCSKLFRRKFNLVQHKKIHRNEKESYQCFECGKNLACRDSIIRHLQLHKKFSFKCDECKKVFISAVQLKNHYKVHIKEKLFSCNLCTESFVEKRKLKGHVKHIHNDIERDVILQPYNNSISECKSESRMKSCSVVLERFQTEINVVYDIKTINSSEPMDDVAPIEVKLEPTDSSESKPFNVSIIYNEEDVEDGISLTNGCVSSSIDEVKQENCIIKLENYDVESVWEEKLEGVVG